MNLKVPFFTNFFWATFFILYDPLEFSTGACPTPSGIEMVKTHHCAVQCIEGGKNDMAVSKSRKLDQALYVRMTVDQPQSVYGIGAEL